MTQTTDFLSKLNPSQRQAVQHFCGPMLVVAGAGTGKTRTLVYRVAYLVETGVPPEQICTALLMRSGPVVQKFGWFCLVTAFEIMPSPPGPAPPRSTSTESSTTGCWRMMKRSR